MPDEETLARWVDDELDAGSAAAVEAWAADQPEWLARREQARELRPLLKSAFAGREEPPYAEFFNARIGREIARETKQASPSPVPSKSGPGIWTWFLPATAVAGMALCFWAGTRVAAPLPVTVTKQAAPELPGIVSTVYTPEKGVNAAYYSSSPADALVIVLDGVAAIPDSFEIPETAAIELPSENTAGLETPTR